jgi:hypothetical protein
VSDHASMPGSETIDAAANEAALCEYLNTDCALGSYTCSFLQHTFLSLWQDKRTCKIASRESPPFPSGGEKACSHASRFITLA